jgi:GH43 family beta-xylosidase
MGKAKLWPSHHAFVLRWKPGLDYECVWYWGSFYSYDLKKNKLRKITFSSGWFDKNMCLVKIMVVVKQKTCPKCLVKNKIGNEMT